MNRIDRNKILIRYLINSGVAKNQREIGALLGYKNESAFSQVINEKVGYPKNFIPKMRELCPDLNRDWLLYGEGEMLKSPKSASVSVVGNDNAVNNSNCQISHGNTANGALDSLQAENTALRKEIAELRSALLDLTRQNQRLMDKLLSLMDGPNTSATARQ